MSGDENNSPRGRLLLWRAEEEGRLEPDVWTDHYTAECVGCLACQSVCPANVPYDLILERTRHRHREAGRVKVGWLIRLATWAVRWPKLFAGAMLPARLARRIGLRPHPLFFHGKPAVWESTADYARAQVEKHQPTGPTVALLKGCLMEAAFREINFATVRVLVRHGYRVIVPEGQGCCGALHEHTGSSGVEELFAQNRSAFAKAAPVAVVTNSAGCGLALSKALKDALPVKDLSAFLVEGPLKAMDNRDQRIKVYVDLPCHLVHGQRQRIPAALLDASGYDWQWAPCAEDCCGSGGVYNLQNPENARRILEDKAAFLETVPQDRHPVIATANHVCMMQWSSARQFIRRPFTVCHVAQLLDETPLSYVPTS